MLGPPGLYSVPQRGLSHSVLSSCSSFTEGSHSLVHIDALKMFLCSTVFITFVVIFFLMIFPPTAHAVSPSLFKVHWVGGDICGHDSHLSLQDEQSAVSMLKKHQILEQAVEDYAETVHQLSKTSRALVADGHPEK